MLSFSGEFFFSFRSTQSVVEGNYSLMGGSGDALHLGRLLYFFLFWPLFCLFPHSRVILVWLGFFLPSPGGCLRG